MIFLVMQGLARRFWLSASRWVTCAHVCVYLLLTSACVCVFLFLASSSDQKISFNLSVCKYVMHFIPHALFCPLFNHTHAHVHVYTHMHIYTYMHPHVHAYTRTRTHVGGTEYSASSAGTRRGSRDSAF